MRGVGIKTITFYTRFAGSIFRDLQDKMTNIFAELPTVLTKKNIPLYDIYFVTKSNCPFFTTSAQSMTDSSGKRGSSLTLMFLILSIH